MSAVMVRVIPLRRPLLNSVTALAIFATPFLMMGMLWYPWPTAVAVLTPCGLAFVRRPWRGGLLMLPPAVVGGAAGLPWWNAPLLALVTAAMCVAFPEQVEVGPAHLAVALLTLLPVVSWAFPSGARASGHQAFHDMAQVVSGFVILAVSAAAPPSPRRLSAVIVLSGTAVALLRGSRPARFVLVWAIVVMAVLAAAVPGVLDMSGGGRSTADLAGNNKVRAESAALAVRLAAENPLRGTGYGSFPEQAARSSDLGVFINTHNDYLWLAAEAGVAPALLLVFLICRGTCRAAGADEQVLAGAVTAYAVVLLFGNTLSNFMASTPFWVCLGVLLRARGAGPACATHDELPSRTARDT